MGVTDGEYGYSPGLGEVESKIRAQNAWVRDQHSAYVSVAYLGAMTPLAGGATISAVRRQLEGAYVAQMLANRPDSTTHGSPLIRLLIANDGVGDEQWPFVVGELARRVHGSDQLVAVTGLGLPSAATSEEVLALHDEHIPIVGAMATSGDLVAKGLATVSMPASVEVAAGVAYERPRARDAVLVYDVDKTDVYANELANEFAQQWRDGSLAREPFNSANDPTGDFRLMRNDRNLCRPTNTQGTVMGSDQALIFFAGREPELEGFVEQLAANNCLGPYEIVTGPDAANESDDMAYLSKLKPHGSVLVNYAGRTLPAEWAYGGLPVPKLFPDFRDTFDKSFRGETLDDGQALVGGDAVWTAIQVVFNIQAIGPVKVDIVASGLFHLGGSNAIASASGSIDLDNCGDRVYLPVAVVQMQFDGTVKRMIVASPQVPPSAALACPQGGG
ncbi:MAG: hypothetical protein E6J41_13220 [Chloroflexi bacterium]|nr:MAG: hypothetical protein E6J41_13220 [Chloroflexota bacterium]